MAAHGDGSAASGGPEHDWRALNRANWDERVPIHLGAKSYDLGPLRAGRGRLHAIEEAELGPVDGLRVLHLQCHFGRDSLTLAQRGADVVGLDFSEPAIAAARELASELGLQARARFVAADVYDAPAAIPDAHAFDLVYVTWGALWWLPDVRRWAEVVAHFLKPGGRLYLADGHPTAFVYDDEAQTADGMPGLFVPYFHRQALLLDDTRDYADDTARLRELQDAAVAASAGRDRHRLDRRRIAHRPAHRARLRALAHVPHPGARCRWHVSLAAAALAAAGLFTDGNPNDDARRVMEGSVPQRAATLAMLRQLERKVLWLSSYMIHHANHEVDRGDGLKVGGHQASSASLVTLMTALYFHVLRPEDRVAVKPHASPVFHAIQYLLGNQSLDKLQNFRAFGGAQSYPSRTKDKADVDFSTGSVGLGIAETGFASLVQDYVHAKGWSPNWGKGRMIGLMGDAEIDEGNVHEALLEYWKHGLENCWWIIDYNRQSLDSVVSDRLFMKMAGAVREPRLEGGAASSTASCCSAPSPSPAASA